MEWPQTATDIICDNTTTDGITNSTMKHQCSWTINMRYFWIIDQVQNLTAHVCWAPGLENLADYFIKHHIEVHHIQVWPYHLHMPHSLHVLPKAPTPWDLLGCVKPSTPSYLDKTTLTKISATWKIQSPCGSITAEATKQGEQKSNSYGETVISTL